jgi:hypothetical protein
VIPSYFYVGSIPSFPVVGWNDTFLHLQCGGAALAVTFCTAALALTGTNREHVILYESLL